MLSRLRRRSRHDPASARLRGYCAGMSSDSSGTADTHPLTRLIPPTEYSFRRSAKCHSADVCRPVDSRARQSARRCSPPAAPPPASATSSGDAENVDFLARPTQRVGDEHSADRADADDSGVAREDALPLRPATTGRTGQSSVPTPARSWSKHPQREHIEGKVRQPRMDEHVGADGPPRSGNRADREERRVNGIRSKERQL